MKQRPRSERENLVLHPRLKRREEFAGKRGVHVAKAPRDVAGNPNLACLDDLTAGTNTRDIHEELRFRFSPAELRYRRVGHCTVHPRRLVTLPR